MKAGYKQTEVGVIPEDWEVARLEQLIVSGPKNGYSGRSGKRSLGTPTLTLGATSSGYLILNEDTVKRLDKVIDPKSNLFLERGDVLVQRSNTADLVGTTAVFTGLPGEFVYPDLMMRMRFRTSETAHWFWRFANSKGGRRFFSAVAAGSSGSMPKINGAKLREMPIPVPSLPEQRAIAEAFGDVDALLSGLDRLLAKRRDLKQAAMQQLLTGQTRLPGFPEKPGYKQVGSSRIPKDWEICRIGSVAKLESGHTPSRRNPSYWGGWIPWVSLHDTEGLNGREILTTSQMITEEGLNHSSARLLPRGTVVFSRTATVGKVTVLGREMATSQDFANYICGPRLHNYFLLYLFRSMTKTWKSLMAGSIHNTIYMPAFEKLEIVVPPLPEQTAIAEVLSDMDAEIAALERRREKSLALKQGMMQELLTGRTRLV